MLAATTAGDGKVYFGGRWYRDGEGGGLGWWDIRSRKGGGISVPFRNYQIHYMTTAGNGRYVVLSTRAVRDAIGKVPRPGSARIFTFDTRTMKLVGDAIPVPGAGMTGPIAAVGGPFVLGMTYSPGERKEARAAGDANASYGPEDRTAVLYKINVETHKVVWTKTLPYPIGFRTNENAMGKDGFDFRLGPDGMVWTYTGGRFQPVNPEKKWHYSYLGGDLCLIRIDPADGGIRIVGRLDQPGMMAFSGRDLVLSGGDRYLAGKATYLRRIRSIVKHAAGAR